MNNPDQLIGDELESFARRVAAASPLHADLITEHGLAASPLPTPAVLGQVTTFRVTIHLRRRPIQAAF